MSKHQPSVAAKIESDILTRGAAEVSLTDAMESAKRLPSKLLSQEPTSSGTPEPVRTTVKEEPVYLDRPCPILGHSMHSCRPKQERLPDAPSSARTRQVGQ